MKLIRDQRANLFTSGIVAVVVWVTNRRARKNLENAIRADQDRLMALGKIPCVHPDHLDDAMSGHEQTLKIIFNAVTPDGVEKIEIFLDQRLSDQLNERDANAWRGLIEYIESDLRHED